MTSLVGVIVGFVLGQIASVLRWVLSSRRANRLCRLLVSLEIQHNLTLLQDYWHNVALPPDEDADDDADDDSVSTAPNPQAKPEAEVDRLARRAVEIPLPILSSRALDSQLGALPNALTEVEMRAVWRFYEDLSQVRALHEWLCALSRTASEKKTGFPSASRAVRSQALTSATFYDTKSAAIFDFRRAIAELLRAGNPLSRPESR